MRTLLILSCTLLAGCLSTTPEPSPTFLGLAPEIWTGTTDQYGVVAFKGLPFAAAPIGARRWQPPQPYEPKAGTTIADRFAPACMQGSHTVDWYQDLIRSLNKDPKLFPKPAQGYDEDCLYLNLWTPNFSNPAQKQETKKRPVMVWIHGGSNKGGWPFEPDYRGAALAQRDVVVVSIAYRVGIFGYFSHPELQAEQGSASNYGLLDLIAALEWIQEHIDEFGGDPSNVTVFGESSGAANIGYLMSTPKADGLFHRAIHQSGGFQLHGTPALSEQTATGVKLGAKLATNLAGLRDLSSADLMAAVDQHLPNISYSSAIGGHALPRSPGAVFAAGEATQIPLLIGTNANEGLMYLAPEQTVASTIAELGLEADSTVITQQLGEASSAVKMDRLSTGPNMRCPSYEMATGISKQGPSAWVYHFDRVRDGAHWQSVGAYHGAEIPYIFDTHANWLETNAADQRLTDLIQRYWVNFAQGGNPNGSNLPQWQPWATAQQVIALNTSVTMLDAPDEWLCELLQQDN